MHRFSQQAFSLVEVLLAAAVLACLGLSIYSTMVSSVRGIATDRLTEAKRHLTQDLLERFCHPYSDLDNLWKPGEPSPATRTLTLDEAMKIVAIPATQVTSLRAILQTGGVSGFTLVWWRGLKTGPGDPARALRMDKLWCFPVIAAGRSGPQVGGFRVFYVRAKP